MPLPEELIEAVTEALDREAAESDALKRGTLLRSTRGILDAWLRGRMTTAEAVERLRASASG